MSVTLTANYKEVFAAETVEFIDGLLRLRVIVFPLEFGLRFETHSDDDEDEEEGDDEDDDGDDDPPPHQDAQIVSLDKFRKH